MFLSGSVQSGGQARGPGPGPIPQPHGLAVQVLAMTRSFRALAAPRLARVPAAPGGWIQAMGPRIAWLVGTAGVSYSHFSLGWVSP